MLGIAATTFLIHKIEQKHPEVKIQTQIIKNFILLMAPVAAIPPLVMFFDIHHYWLYAVYVFPATIWIGSGIRIGYQTKALRTKNYRTTFFRGCVFLVYIGIGVHLLLQAKPF